MNVKFHYKDKVKDWDKFRDQFVRETLRRASFRWPPRNMALQGARAMQKPSEKTGRICWHYFCANCKGIFLASEVKLDHIEPVMPIVPKPMDRKGKAGCIQWGMVMPRMFPEAKGFQVLCAECHTAKTNRERDERRGRTG